MTELRVRELMRSLKIRPTASNHFAEEVRNDEVLNKAILDEVFQLMSQGLERVWPKH